MKRTPEDDAFIVGFTRELNSRYSAAVQNGSNDPDFARSIGVTRQALKKYLAGKSMPSLQTVVLAFKHHQISVPYASVQLFGTRRKKATTKTQLTLPFEIRPLHSGDIALELKPIKPHTYTLRLEIGA